MRGIILMILILVKKLSCVLAYSVLVKLIYLYRLSSRLRYLWYANVGFSDSSYLKDLTVYFELFKFFCKDGEFFIPLVTLSFFMI
ncbi:hypothetical protein CISIN_1g034770mg [Citrus sinensis]|uniref:Uncharacterized protein n=1 Tax=Citrus sinensis TaxID=2711 RepID=A0A067H4S7_CITSI|nr:hypothetical protein CISIN_1g034770mg [Citrus sinensis]